jgi:hypothetical protein
MVNFNFVPELPWVPALVRGGRAAGLRTRVACPLGGKRSSSRDVMAASSRLMITEAERRFPVRAQDLAVLLRRPTMMGLRLG